jgi:hypothetical protein
MDIDHKKDHVYREENGVKDPGNDPGQGKDHGSLYRLGFPQFTKLVMVIHDESAAHTGKVTASGFYGET